jgi:hypothetical protein
MKKISHHERKAKLKIIGYSKEEIKAALAHAGHKKKNLSQKQKRKLKEEKKKELQLLRQHRREEKKRRKEERRKIKQDKKKQKELLKKERKEELRKKDIVQREYAKVKTKDIKREDKKIDRLNQEIADLQIKIKKEKIELEEKKIAKPPKYIHPVTELENKVKALIDEGFEEDAIISSLLALGKKEWRIKWVLKKLKKEKRQKQKKVVVRDTSKTKTEIDDVYYTIKEQEKITIAELADKLKMDLPQLRKWIDYLEKDGLITVKCRFGGTEIVKIKEEY